MTLRRQLLLVSLLVLVLPWAGYQYVQEMERALRAAQQRALLGSAQALAFAAAPYLPPGAPAYADSILAHPLSRPLALDGYAGDWDEAAHWLAPARFSGTRLDQGAGAGADPPLRVALVEHGADLYLLAEARDESVRYFNPGRGQVNGDRLVLRVARQGHWRDYVYLTSAPGLLLGRDLDGRRPGDRVAGLQAAWSSFADGFRVEMRIPPSRQGDALALFWIDSDPGAAPRWWGTAPALVGAQGSRLVRHAAALQERLRQFVTPGTRVRLADDDGWIVADVARAPEETAADLSVGGVSAALLQRLVRLVLQHERPRAAPFAVERGRLARNEFAGAAYAGGALSGWYKSRRFAPSTLVAVVPVARADTVGGVLLLEQSSDLVAAITDLAMTRLVLLTLLAMLLVAAGLLAYASWLSWRVRRLRDTMARAVDADGVIRDDLPVSRAGDEIGELSRGYGALLQRLREYTAYLRKLAGNLSHELRTPLAVVSSSLENLRERGLDPDADTYAERAQQGAARLRAILHAMSEATRVEHALETAGERQRFDLGVLLRDCVPAYRDVYPDRRIELTLPGAPCEIDGVPELLVQMLDKLIDNAVDFSPPGGRIDIRLSQVPKGCLLAVSNPGPLLPAAMQAQLFEPMVSVREGRSEVPHLGFGLYIARLIATVHRARISARNLPDLPGVVFEARFARSVQAGAGTSPTAQV